jgi:hypothetical protein
MEPDERQKVRLALAALFISASLIREKSGEQVVSESLALADALLRAVPA